MEPEFSLRRLRRAFSMIAVSVLEVSSVRSEERSWSETRCHASATRSESEDRRARSSSVKGVQEILLLMLITPTTLPPILTGTERSDLVSYWWRFGRPNLGSSSMFVTRSGSPCSATQPAIESPIRIRVPHTTSSRSPRAARM